MSYSSLPPNLSLHIVYDWQYFLSSANKTLASAMRSVDDHENIVDLFKIGLIFSKAKCYARNTTPSTILHKNQGETHGVDDDYDEDGDDREAKQWLTNPPRSKGNSCERPLPTTRDQTKMIATPGGTLSAWTLRPNLARTFYGHNSVTSLLFKITGKRIGTTHWAEEPNLPYKTPVFRAKCQFAGNFCFSIALIYFLLKFREADFFLVCLS